LIHRAVFVSGFDQANHARQSFTLTFDITRSPNSGADVQAAYDLSRWPCCGAEWRHDAHKGSRDASFF
jgi:hypothetical protein